jgi:hypothetical protein
MAVQIINSTDAFESTSRDKINDNFSIVTELSVGWLSSGESWSYGSADAPTYTITVPNNATTKYSVGMRIKLTQATGGTKYFIITKVEATTLTVYGGTDYALVNEAITAPCYSTQKAPFGFPLDPAKWSEEYTATAQEVITCNGGSWTVSTVDMLVVPIGLWNLGYRTDFYLGVLGSNIKITLSSTDNGQSHEKLTAAAFTYTTTTIASPVMMGFIFYPVNLTSKTTFKINVKDGSSGGADATIGQYIRTNIRAICAYL